MDGRMNDPSAGWRQPLISADGRWWWDGARWNAIHGRHDVIAIHRRVPMQYTKDVEPPELRARFGAILLVIGFALTLPAMGAGTIFTMAIVTGQDPLWPTIAEGVAIFAVVLGLLGVWPLIGLLLGFGIRDGLRWVLLCLTLSGAVPAVFLGGLLVIGSPGLPATSFVDMEVGLAWMWLVPLLGLALMRATHAGKPLPAVATFAGMFGSAFRQRLPGVQTQTATVVRAMRYPLRVPGANFAMPPDAADAIYGSGGRVRVTYDLRSGRIDTIEVGVSEPGPPTALP
jgi:hypothetical protein